MEDSTRALAGLLAAVSVVSGCGGSSGNGGDFTGTAESFVGIYAVDDRTLNDAACAAEGPSSVSTLTETYLVSHRDELFGTPFLLFVSCVDPADCRDKAAELAQGQGVFSELSYTFSEIESADHLSGITGLTGYNDGDVCRDGGSETLDLIRQGDTIAIELRGHYADFAPDEEGICWSDRGAAAAEGAPCTRFEVLRATFSEPL